MTEKRTRELHRLRVEVLLGLLGNPAGDWNVEQTEFSLSERVVIKVRNCDNSTQVGKRFEIRRVTWGDFFGRDLVERNLFAISTTGTPALAFEVIEESVVK